jgi:hypothetical protein
LVQVRSDSVVLNQSTNYLFIAVTRCPEEGIPTISFI